MRHGEVEAAFRQYGPLVFHRARALLGEAEAAKDIVQEVFIAAFTELHDFDARRGSISSWLYRVTTNRCLNLLRDTQRHRRLALLRMSTSASSAGAAQADNRILVRSLLAGAEVRCAEAAVYVHMDGMSHAEAAELLGVSRKTVGNLLDRFGHYAQKTAGSSDQPRSTGQEEPA